MMLTYTHILALKLSGKKKMTLTNNSSQKEKNVYLTFHFGTWCGPAAPCPSNFPTPNNSRKSV